MKAFVLHAPEFDFGNINREELSLTLLRAADTIDEQGWTQGDWFEGGFSTFDPVPSQCPSCLLGSVVKAKGYTSLADAFGHGGETTFTAAEAYLNALVNHNKERIVTDLSEEDRRSMLYASEWNDMEGRTQEEVTTLLRMAAVLVHGD